MYWNKELSYTITPRGGPMRSMETLIDANHALSKDLPLAYLRRRHWLEAGNQLVEAASTGANADVELATEKLLFAIEHEGWMDRQVLIPGMTHATGDSVPPEFIPKRKGLIAHLQEKRQPLFSPRVRQLEYAPSRHAHEDEVAPRVASR
jgi:hypothetical protein